jgi:hypothetical protein
MIDQYEMAGQFFRTMVRQGDIPAVVSDKIKLARAFEAYLWSFHSAEGPSGDKQSEEENRLFLSLYEAGYWLRGAFKTLRLHPQDLASELERHGSCFYATPYDPFARYGGVKTVAGVLGTHAAARAVRQLAADLHRLPDPAASPATSGQEQAQRHYVLCLEAGLAGRTTAALGAFLAKPSDNANDEGFAHVGEQLMRTVIVADIYKPAVMQATRNATRKFASPSRLRDASFASLWPNRPFRHLLRI